MLTLLPLLVPTVSASWADVEGTQVQKLAETLLGSSALATVVDDYGLSLSPSGGEQDLEKFELPLPVVEQFGARCLDGSPFAYYFRPHTSEAGRDKFVFFLQGGGLCVTPIDCAIRAGTKQGSSKEWERFIDHDNVAGSDERSPFAGWNHVFMRYCSGDTWTGQRFEPDPLVSLYFNGHNHIAATISELRRTAGLGDATQVLLSGASAGGIGVNNNCDWFARQFPGAETRCMPQAGLFFPANTVAQWQLEVGNPSNLTANQIAGLYLTEYFGARLDESCVASQRAAGEPEQYCWDAGLVLEHIDTRLFVVQNYWDQLQMASILCWRDNFPGDACPAEYLSKYKNNTLTQLASLADRRRLDGAWMPSCYKHTENTCVVSGCRVMGLTMAEAASNWYRQESGDSALMYLDDCVGSDPDSAPCNSECGGCGAQRMQKMPVPVHVFA